jgi:hypothetical protein
MGRRVFAAAAFVFIATAAGARGVAGDGGHGPVCLSRYGQRHGEGIFLRHAGVRHGDRKFIDQFFVARRFDSFRQAPGLVRELRPLQDCKRSLQANAGGRVRILY